MKNKEIEFLKESNAIEREYSKESLEDSIKAWKYAKVFLNHKIDIPFIKTIHEFLMKRLNSRIAGKIRECPIYVGTRINYRECMKPEVLDTALKHWIRNWSQKTTEKGIKDSHIQFEKIHPFEDGNGRVGRILMNIQRLKSKLPILIIHEGKEQMEYYKWFKNSQ